MPEPACAAVILAAGASTRLGQPKQLISIGGETLLSRTARLAREAGCDPVIVVLGFDAARMCVALADAPVILVQNHDWQSGMGSSLRRGIAAVTQLDPPPSEALLLVCDQLALTAGLLRELRRVHACGEKPITAACYAERPGVPAIFSARYFAELMEVEGDRGARGVIDRHAEDVALVEFEDGTLDLDMPEQLRDLK